MKGPLHHGGSKGKKPVKLLTLSSGTSTTVSSPVALQAGIKAKLPEVSKELPLLFLEESEELLVSEDPQSESEPVTAGQTLQPHPNPVPRVICSLLPDQQHPGDREFFPGQQSGSGSGSSFGQTWQRGDIGSFHDVQWLMAATL